MFRKGDDEPHLAGWFRGKPVYRGTKAEWSQMFRIAVEQWGRMPDECKLGQPGPDVPLGKRP
jgi:hypothetical protein